MPILDSAVFPAGGGGGVAKLWTSALAVTQYDSVLSPINLQGYRRITPGGITALDPAADKTNYIEIDGSHPIGSVKLFNDLRNLPSVITMDGRSYVATGSVALAADYPAVPPTLHSMFDYWEAGTTTFTYAHHGLECDASTGVVMALDYTGKVFTSSNDGVTWSAGVQIPSWASDQYSCLLSTNNAGTWMAVDGGGKVYISTNNGVTWTQKTTAYAGQIFMLRYGVGRFWLAPRSYPGTGFLAYTSVDSGATWQTVSLSPLGTNTSSAYDICFVPGTNRVGIFYPSNSNTAQLAVTPDYPSVPFTVTFANYIPGGTDQFGTSGNVGQQPIGNVLFWDGAAFVAYYRHPYSGYSSSGTLYRGMRSDGASISVPNLVSHVGAVGGSILSANVVLQGAGLNFIGATGKVLKNFDGTVDISRVSKTFSNGATGLGSFPRGIVMKGDIALMSSTAINLTGGVIYRSRKMVGHPTKIVTPEGLISYIRIA